MALGLGYWQMMRLIVLPQALKIVIPGIVNTFIGLFKDTTLVFIVGMFDFLRHHRGRLRRSELGVARRRRTTGYVFAAIVLLDLLLRHVALLAIHGSAARHRPQDDRTVA